MLDQASLDTLLRRVDALSREVLQLRRELLRGAGSQPVSAVRKPTLFGSVKAEDITDSMIEDAKRALFRPRDDL